VFTGVYLSITEEVKNSAAKNGNGPKKREAVLDRGEQIKTSANYVPKVSSLFSILLHYLYLTSIRNRLSQKIKTFVIYFSMLSLQTSYSHLMRKKNRMPLSMPLNLVPSLRMSSLSSKVNPEIIFMLFNQVIWRFLSVGKMESWPRWAIA